MRYFCTTPKHLEEVFALPRMLMIKTLLTIWDNTSALVPTHTMITAHYICLGWSLLHFLHLEVYAASFVLHEDGIIAEAWRVLFWVGEREIFELVIKTLLVIWDNTSALVPTHTMIARSTLSWWTREREKERKRVMHELAAIMVCARAFNAWARAHAHTPTHTYIYIYIYIPAPPNWIGRGRNHIHFPDHTTFDAKQ